MPKHCQFARLNSGCPLSFTLLLAVAFQPAHFSHADVIVLANRAAIQVPLRFVPEAGETQQFTLPPDDTVPMFVDGRANLMYSSKGTPKQYLLDANCAYYFGRGPNGQIDLQKIGLGNDGMTAAGRKLPGSASRAPAVMIPVKILVDEEERARPAYWERRLRARVDAASKILERHCHVGFRVEAIGTWQSDNAINDFFESLADFERKVDPAPARIAIGFTSQWKMERGRIHMAGTRGPLHTHILVREGSPEINEAERLEFLVHELGHYLGAAHSPESTSVMRPVLGDNRAGTTGFRVRFDPVNTLCMSMVSEEIRRTGLTKITELQPVTRQRLEKIYLELARALPNDPAGMQYAMLMRSGQTPITVAAKKVLQQIVHAAIDNRSLPATAVSGSNQPARRDGDALTEYYVREAAKAASTLPEDVAAPAFLLGVVIGLDHTNGLTALSIGGNLITTIEPQSERLTRLAVLGKPTMRGNSDLLQRFFGSAFLTAAMGADAAQPAILDLELQLAQQPSGFSFKYIAADRAGSWFGRTLKEKRLSLGMISRMYTVASFMPDVEKLPDGIAAKDLAAEYGKQTDPRFVNKLREIDRLVTILPGYRATAAIFGR
jgi:hypothetical protein